MNQLYFVVHATVCIIQILYNVYYIECRLSQSLFILNLVLWTHNYYRLWQLHIHTYKAQQNAEERDTVKNQHKFKMPRLGTSQDVCDSYFTESDGLVFLKNWELIFFLPHAKYNSILLLCWFIGQNICVIVYEN